MLVSIVTLGVLGLCGAVTAAALGAANAVAVWTLYSLMRGFLGETSPFVSFHGVDTDYASVRKFLSCIIATSSCGMYIVQVIYLIRSGHSKMPWRLVLPSVPIELVGAVGGAFVLDTYGRSPYIPFVLGGFFAIFAAAYIIISARKTGVVVDENAELDEKKVMYGLMATSLASGFSGGALAIAGPPLIVFALAVDLPKSYTRIILPFNYLIAVFFKMAYHSLTLDYGIQDVRMGLIYLAAFSSGAAVGMIIGNHVGLLLPPRAFKETVAFALFVAGMTFLQVPSLVILGTLVAFVLWQYFRAPEAPKLGADGNPETPASPTVVSPRMTWEISSSCSKQREHTANVKEEGSK